MEHLLFTYWLAWMFQVESPQMIWARSVCYFIFCLKVTYWKYLTLKYVLSEMLRILFSRHSINRIYCHESSLAALFGLLMSWSSCSYRSRFLPLVIVASLGHPSHHNCRKTYLSQNLFEKIGLFLDCELHSVFANHRSKIMTHNLMVLVNRWFMW